MAPGITGKPGWQIESLSRASFGLLASAKKYRNTKTVATPGLVQQCNVCGAKPHIARVYKSWPLFSLEPLDVVVQTLHCVDRTPV